MVSLIGQLIIDGLGMGLIYVLLSTGFVLILSIPRILFVAYGQFYMVGAYIVWACLVLLKWPFFISLLVAVLCTSILGAISYRLIYHYILKRHFLSGIVASIALMMILGQAALLIFGTHSRGMPSVFPGMIRIGGMSISVEKLVLIMLTTAVIFALYFFLRKSKTGQAMRAVSFNADVAALQGINPERIYQSALVIGCALAGFAGAVMAPVYAVSPSMGSIIITVLLVVMFGGMNSVMGAALGGIILGLTLSFGYYFLGGGLAQILLFLAISIIVFFRPGGLFGESINEF